VLKRDGTVAHWTNPPNSAQPTPDVQNFYARFRPPEALTNVIAIGIGGEDQPRSLAVVKGGAVVPWWGSGPLPDNMVAPVGLSNVVAVAAGAAHSLALTSDGIVWGWGSDGVGELSGRPPVLSGKPAEMHARAYSGPIVLSGQPLTNVAAISAGRYHSMALKRDGTVVVWGKRDAYSDVPEGLSGVVAIAAAQGYCLAITTNKAVAEKFIRPR
jgi:alpha-tubulin suppressor-like RCC1 family protein